MAEIAEYTEKHISYIHRFHTTEFEIHSNLDAVSHATCAMAIDVGAKCIVVSSMSGRTARMVSRFLLPGGHRGYDHHGAGLSKAGSELGRYPGAQ